MNRWMRLAILAGLAFVLVFTANRCGGRRDPAPADGGPSAPAAAHDPERENPDRAWIDLAKEPFHPEWVGGTLLILRAQPPTTLNALFTASNDEPVIAKHFLFPSLLIEIPDAVDGAFEAEAQIATAVPRLEEDRRTVRFDISSGVTWEDGPPVTAHDYAFTWNLINDEGVAATRRQAEFEHLESVTAVDDDTVEVRYEEPYYRAVLSFGLGFTVVPRHRYEGMEGARFKEELRTPSYGPYRVLASDSDHLLLALRPEYRTKPHVVGPRYVEQVEYRFRGATGNPVEQLKAGATDITVIPSDAYDRLDTDAVFNERCWKTFYYLPAWQFVGWNLTDHGNLDRPHPLFGDRRVRRALSMLIPRERLCREHYHGRARPVSGPAFFKDKDYDSGIVADPYDPETAARLLDEAGFRLNAEGVREKDGRELRFDLLHPSTEWAVTVVTVIQESFRKAGILAEARPLGPTGLNDVVYPKRFDAVVYQFVVRPPIQSDFWEFFHSSEAPKEALNFVGLRDPEIDRLLLEARNSFDPTARSAVQRRLHAAIHDLQPFAFLVAKASEVGVSRRWANVKVHDLGIWYRDFVLRERFGR